MAHNGRELTIDWDSVTLVGVRSRTVSMTNEMVDVTTDDDDGWRRLLAKPGLKSVEVQISGITENEVLVAEFFNANTTGEPLRINLPTGLTTAGNISGTFHLSSFEYPAEHDGAVEFSVTFMSSGVVTYVASSGA